MRRWKLLKEETVMPDDASVFPGYLYICDMVFTRYEGLLWTTVGRWRELDGIGEVRRCEIFGSGRAEACVGDEVELWNSWVELIGPTKMRFHHPCGHTSMKDYSKGKVARRMGPEGCKMMASWWSKDKGGVRAPCPKCFPKKTAAQRVGMGAVLSRTLL